MNVFITSVTRRGHLSPHVDGLRRGVFLGLIGLVVLLAGAYAAEEGDPREAVLRVQDLDGAARIVRVYGVEQTAMVNEVLAEGDTLETEDGRVELSMGNGVFIRVNRYASLTVMALQPDASEGAHGFLQLRAGAVFLDTQGVRHTGGMVRLRLDTPDVTLWMDQPALVRVDVRPESGTYVRVLFGSAELLHTQGSVRVEAGEAVLGVRPDLLPSPQPVSTLSADGFDEWNEARRRALTRRSVSPYLPDALYYDGIELERYGTWRSHPRFGPVWIPPLTGPWFPYTNGHWVWAGDWIWVPYEPWGWVTHHYGWWYFDTSWGWLWIPRPIFRFAWVIWYPVGPYIGWCPIGIFGQPLTIISLHLHLFPVSYWDPQGRPWIFVRRKHMFRTPVLRYRVKESVIQAVRINPRAFRTRIDPPWEIGALSAKYLQRARRAVVERPSKLLPHRPQMTPQRRAVPVPRSGGVIRPTPPSRPLVVPKRRDRVDRTVRPPTPEDLRRRAPAYRSRPLRPTPVPRYRTPSRRPRVEPSPRLHRPDVPRSHRPPSRRVERQPNRRLDPIDRLMRGLHRWVQPSPRVAPSRPTPQSRSTPAIRSKPSSRHRATPRAYPRSRPRRP